jgi:septal ring factor EnvC (AmiA/AmiB activator)
MKKIIFGALLATFCSALLVAQFGGRMRGEPSNDEITAYLGLTETQIACLQANRDALKEALAPHFETMRSLQMQLRQANRDGADTTAIQAQIETERENAKATHSSFVATAQGCVGSAQAAKIAELVAAEALMREVRQGVGLLLLTPTDTPGFGGPGPGFGGHAGPGGPGMGGGRRGPGGVQ